MNPSQSWGQSAWPDLRERRAGPPIGRVCLLPVGAIEQHGPHLPCDTDTVIAQAVCAAAAAQSGCVALPPLAYGCSFGHAEAWPGTLSLDPETLTATIRQLGSWLLATGFDRLLVINSHFGNWAAIRCAIDHLRLRHAGAIHVGAFNTWELSPAVKAWFVSDGDDIHANRAETSLLMHLAPDSVVHERVASADDPDRTAGLVFSWLVSQTSTNGVTGSPSLATAAEGEVWFAKMVEALCAIVARAAVEEAPIAWMPPEGHHRLIE